MSAPEVLRKKLEGILRESIVSFEPASGGDISHAALVRTPSGCFFLKWKENAPDEFFSAEAENLASLAKCKGVCVPGVIAWSDAKEDGSAFLLLEALSPGRKERAGERDLGRMLATLHRTTASRCGFHRDNFIGATPQQNSWAESWGEFFFQNRLGAQARLGRERGWYTSSFESSLRAKEKEILHLLASDPSPPSLLHGDLWGGNVFWSAGGPVLIDPACYFGSRETDLAFTELFGGFGGEFYSAYDEAYPRDDGHRGRATLYNLYHLMNHANLFGGSSVASVRRVLESGFM